MPCPLRGMYHRYIIVIAVVARGVNLSWIEHTASASRSGRGPGRHYPTTRRGRPTPERTGRLRAPVPQWTPAPRAARSSSRPVGPAAVVNRDPRHLWRDREPAAHLQRGRSGAGQHQAGRRDDRPKDPVDAVGDPQKDDLAASLVPSARLAAEPVSQRSCTVNQVPRVRGSSVSASTRTARPAVSTTPTLNHLPGYQHIHSSWYLSNRYYPAVGRRAVRATPARPRRAHRATLGAAVHTPDPSVCGGGHRRCRRSWRA